MGKYISLSLLVVFILFSCQPQETLPEDVAGLKNMLTSLKSERTTLEQKIKEIEEKIEVLEPAKEKPRKLVTADTLEKADFKRFVDVQGAVAASDIVNAVPEIGGRIKSMKLDEGDYVKAGSLVATIDVESYQKQIAEIETSLELANDVFERQKRLWEQEIGSEIQYLQAKNNKERLEKSLETLQFQLSKANVYAPISGYVDMVFLEEGEFAGPGSPIIQIMNINTVKVVADVPETFLGKVNVGEYVNIHFPALETDHRGKVTLIGKSIDAANRTFKVEINLSNPKGALKPNLLSVVKINDLTVENTIAIPLDLVQQEISGKDYVYVVGNGEEGQISEKRFVKTGPTFENLIVIENGLEEGEIIIKDGARGLANEELIKIQG